MYEIRGAEELAALAKRLRQAGDKDLQRKLYAAINRSTKPLKAELPGSARRTLPRRGGLAERVAKSKYKTQRRTTGRAIGIRVTATNRMEIARMDRGVLRHKTFGHLPWETQRVPPGWFTRPADAAAPAARAELDAAMKDITQELNRR